MRTMWLVAVLALLAPGAARADLFSSYAVVLKARVDDHGLVDYAGLKADRAGLDAFVESIAALPPAEYEAWPAEDRLAFWLNAYNALTLRLIIDNYPVARAPGRDRYPASSIQQIPDAWSRPRYTVMGQVRSLDEIEHQIIRAQFHEPRVHLALVCAALSCPPLRREPYRGAGLGAQLDDQGRRFFSDLRNLQVDREKNEVFVSRILEWFADDFAPGVLEEKGQPAAKRHAVTTAAGPYVKDDIREYLAGEKFTLDYFEYDWTLNEQSK